MTLTTEVDRTQTTGNGSDVIFDYNFKIWEDAEIEVVRSNKVSPLEKDVLTIITDYTVQDAGEAAGGTVTLQGAHAASPPTSDENLTCLRKLEFKQEVGVTNQGGFKGNMHEKRYDWIVALIQQLKGMVDRCFQVDEVSMADTADLTYEDMLARSPTLLDVATGAGAELVVTGDLSDYEQCRIELLGLLPAVDDADLIMYISEDGGSTWISLASSFLSQHHGYRESIGVVSGSSSGTTMFLLHGSALGQNSAALAELYGNIYVSAAAGPSFAFLGNMRYVNTGGTEYEIMLHLSGRLKSSGYTVNAIKFVYSNGNFASGTVRLWGMPTGE